MRALPPLRPQLEKERFYLGTSTEETTTVMRAGLVGGALGDSAEVPTHLPSWCSLPQEQQQSPAHHLRGSSEQRGKGLLLR